MKIALSGYGKMGRAIEAVALERGHVVVAREGRLSGHSRLDEADVVIDFSNAEQIEVVIEAACEAGVNLVIGTTGWNDRLEEVRRRCREANLGVVHAANFSPGAMVTFALAREAARLISRFGGYEAGIEERHHSQKKDAPSGTALRIAREVEAGSDGTLKPVISSSRVGTEYGLHTLFFDSKDDLIELSHRARGRDGFARGAVLAAEMLGDRKGFFTFEELIGLQKRTRYPMTGSEKFRGLGVALVTPFTRDGAVDEAAFEEFVDWQIGEGTDFLVPCGTTGENPALTQEEHLRVVELTVKRAGGKVPVLAGAGSNATPKAVELALAARDLGADGLLSITPYYNKPTPDGLIRHFGAQAEAVNRQAPGFPMIVYNVPGRTGVNMTAATTLRIAREIPNVIGVKEASGNMEQILSILRDRPRDFLVLSGDDAWTLPLMAAGAEGVISVAGNEIPRLMKQMVAAARAQHYDEARTIHNRILPLLTGNFIESNPIPVKAAMKMMGILRNDLVRSPLAPLTGPSQEKMREILVECDLLSATVTK